MKVTAERAWAAMGVGILAYEATCPPGELLSEGVDRAIEKHPIIVPVLIGAVALHLANKIPERWDGVHHLSRFIGRKV